MKILLYIYFVLVLLLYTNAAPTKSKETAPDETNVADDTTVIDDVKIKEQTTIDSKTVNKGDDTVETVPKSENIEIPDTTKSGLDINLGKLPLNKLWTPYGMMAPTSGNTAFPMRVRSQTKNMFSMMRPRKNPMWNKTNVKQSSGVLTSLEENGQNEGNANDVGKKNETHIQERKTRKEKTKASWTTTLANGESIKENIVLSRGSNVMMMRSETDNYKALTIIDFNSKKHAIKIRMKKAEKEDDKKGKVEEKKVEKEKAEEEKVEKGKIEEEKVEEKKVEKKKVTRKRKFNFMSKIRHLFRRHSKSQRELCFILDADVNIDEVYMEIDAREKNETVETGNEQVFYVNGDDKVSKGDMKKAGVWIKTFCKKAAAAGKVYNLVSESTAEMNPEPIVVMGQIDASQKGKSVPYKINLDSSINIHS